MWFRVASTRRPEVVPLGIEEWFRALPVSLVELRDVWVEMIAELGAMPDPKVTESLGRSVVGSDKIRESKGLSGKPWVSLADDMRSEKFGGFTVLVIAQPSADPLADMAMLNVSGYRQFAELDDGSRRWLLNFSDGIEQHPDGLILHGSCPDQGSGVRVDSESGALVFEKTPAAWVEQVYGQFVESVRAALPISYAECDATPWSLTSWPAFQHAHEITGYQWAIALSEASMDVLGGVDEVARSAPVWRVDPVEGVDGSGLVLRLSEHPGEVTAQMRSQWRSYLSPILPAKAPATPADVYEISWEYTPFRELCEEDIDWPGRDRSIFKIKGIDG